MSGSAQVKLLALVRERGGRATKNGASAKSAAVAGGVTYQREHEGARRAIRGLKRDDDADRGARGRGEEGVRVFVSSLRQRCEVVSLP